jgi:cytochrome c oxidase assembly factor 2
MTGTLFTGTLAVSFLVVGIPHLLPCPADRRQFADSAECPDGRVPRRRKKRDADGNLSNSANAPSSPAAAANDEALASLSEDERPKRECPVPKPGGLLGQIIGFRSEERMKPVEVVVQSRDTRRVEQVRSKDDGL